MSATTKNNAELTQLITTVRDLLILLLSTTDVPNEKIAKAAHIRKEKLYEIIPKQKKHTQKENKKNE